MAAVFGALAIPPRPGKPRTTGVTAVIDRGPDLGGWMGLQGTEDFLAAAAEFVDYAKIYAAHSLMLPEAWVRRKIALYEGHGVRAYSGGILMEIAYLQGRLAAFYAGVKSLGLHAIEISENYLALTPAERRRLIAETRDRGLDVFFEFGSKHPARPRGAEETIEAIAPLVDAGARHVIIEQAEIDLWRAHDPEALRAVSRAIGAHHLLWEMDPNLFPANPVWLLERLGPAVNLGNVHPDQLLRIEEFRRGLGRAIGFPFVAGGARTP